MPNVNKVVYGNDTIIDLTSDTVTPSDVLNSKSFHDASGTLRTGSADLSKYYSTDDTADTDIDSFDYVPFYDTSATTKKKITWSSLLSKAKTYFDTLYDWYAGYGLFKVGNNLSVINHSLIEAKTNTDTSTTFNYKVSRTRKEVSGSIGFYDEIVPDSMYADETATLSTSTDTTIVFDGSGMTMLSQGATMVMDYIISSTSEISVFCSIYGLNPKSVTVDGTNNTCTVVFPPYTSAEQITCRIRVN